MNSSYTLPVNLGNPIEHTISGIQDTNFFPIIAIIYLFISLEFAQIIKSLVSGSNSSVRHLPAVEDDPQQRRPDISRAKKYIDWEPKVNLFFFVERPYSACLISLSESVLSLPCKYFQSNPHFKLGSLFQIFNLGWKNITVS